MTRETGKIKPLDAFVKYVLDVKPYRTKLLEVVEKYTFSEDMSIDMPDSLFTTVKYANPPLCRPVGFGLIFDECGYSNDECCDLFQCVGGFGLVFDNSVLVASYPIKTFDTAKDEIVIDGNHVLDTRLKILEVHDTSIIVESDVTGILAPNTIVILAPYNIYNILDVTGNTISIAGDHQTEFLRKREFYIRGSHSMDGGYSVSSVSFNAVAGVTRIVVAGNPLNGVLANGHIEIESNTPNQGVFSVSAVELYGINTKITVRDRTFVDSGNELGCIQIRDGLIAPRTAWVYDAFDASSNEYRIVDSYYNATTDQTHVVMAEFTVLPTYGLGELRLHGFITNAGFDNNELCDRPKPTNIHTLINEKLSIRVIPVTVP